MTQPISDLRIAQPNTRDLEPNQEGKNFAQAFIDERFRATQAMRTPLIEACIDLAKYKSLRKDETNSSHTAKRLGAGDWSSLDTSNRVTSAARRKELDRLRNKSQARLVIEKIDEEIEKLKAMKSYFEPLTGAADKHPVRQDSTAWSMPD